MPSLKKKITSVKKISSMTKAKRIITPAPATGSESDDELAETEKEVPDVPEDEDDGTAPSTTKSSKSKKVQKLILTPEEEDDLAEWVKEHPDIYDKSSKGYKETDKRKRVWRLKAEEMKVDVAALIRKYAQKICQIIEEEKWRRGQ